MEIKLIMMFLVIHFLADFVLQTDYQAKNKYKGGEALITHCFTYTLVWVPFIYFLTDSPITTFFFCGITFIAHYMTDLVTSNLSKPLFEEGNHHGGFIVVGADQVLHYFQLLATYYFITQNLLI